MELNIKVIITLLSISLIFSIVVNINDNRKIEIHNTQNNSPSTREITNINTKYYQKNTFNENVTQINN